MATTGIIYAHYGAPQAAASTPQVAAGGATPAPTAPTAPTAPDDLATVATLTKIVHAINNLDMHMRMSKATGFDEKNKIFHEYFDAIPEQDKQAKTGAFYVFMAGIEKADADRVIQYLESQPK